MILNAGDMARASRRRLPRAFHDFIEGGAQDGVAARDSVQAFGAWRFRPRVLRDVSVTDLSRTTFGTPYAAPFGIAPMGLAGLAAFRGDLAMARAAGRAGIPYVLSSASTTPMEQVIRANGDAWFQLYASTAPGSALQVLDRVAAAGFRTLVVTVDVPVLGNREADLRNGYGNPLVPGLRSTLDAALHPRWLAATFLRTLVADGLPRFENHVRRAPLLAWRRPPAAYWRDHLTWDTLAALREAWPHRLVLKGLLASQDALRARRIGADAVAVSNHGGRQLDGAIAPLYALRDIAATRPGVPLLYDGGVRRGGDVLKAVALGAGHVFIGRPFMHALAVAGEAGVLRMAQLLKDEIARDMALLGCASLDEVAACVEPAPCARAP